MTVHRLSTFLLSVLISLGGCSSLPLEISDISSPSSSPLSERYLRGVFNWWEANEAFRFVQGSNGWYVDVELIADGQPYDFKLSDANWLPNNTCGADTFARTVITGSEVFLSCGAGVENLRFTPEKTAKYRFLISTASRNELRLVILPLG